MLWCHALVMQADQQCLKSKWSGNGQPETVNISASIFYSLFLFLIMFYVHRFIEIAILGRKIMGWKCDTAACRGVVVYFDHLLLLKNGSSRPSTGGSTLIIVLHSTCILPGLDCSRIDIEILESVGEGYILFRKYFVCVTVRPPCSINGIDWLIDWIDELMLI